MTITEYDKAKAAADTIKPQLPDSNVKTAIICGTGLGGIADVLIPNHIVQISYKDIPHFKTSTVSGHAGKLIIGYMPGQNGRTKVPVICMSGRLHSYEGYDIKDTVLPIRTFQLLGIDTIIVTNAAGGLNQSFRVGDIMLLDDHINVPGLAGLHPLKGSNDDRFGTRFPALSDAYDYDLRKMFFDSASHLGITRPIHEGTYAFVSGPTYESRAECRFLLNFGADAVGMSTVSEVITARHGNMRVLALSLITNIAVIEKTPSATTTLTTSLAEGKATHAEVVEAGAEAASDIQKIVAHLVGKLTTQ